MTKKQTFKKRTMPVGKLLAEILSLVRHRKQLRKAMKNPAIPVDFRERLMLAVTAVNECRYCSYAHTRMALEAGMGDEEVKALCAGAFSHSPEQQVTALIFAQHWAESEAKVSAVSQEQMVATYGQALTADILIVLRMIRMGNMLGNSWDLFLYKISFGHWGNCQA